MLGQPRIGRVDAVDVSIDVAARRADGGGERHRRRVRTAAAERCNAPVRSDALKAGHDGDLAIVDRLAQRLAGDFGDPRLAVGHVGFQRDLPALPGARPITEILHDQREETASDLLARSDHRVVFDVARVERRRGFACIFAQGDQTIRLASHGGDHDGDGMAGVYLAAHKSRRGSDAVEIGD